MYLFLANINVHKLDAAFDIDPLFHKMSKTFDEGGAKGLLLANLSVSETGCNIVFDSTLDDEGDAGSKQSKTIHGSANQPTVDVTSLTASLDSSLNGQTVHQLPLVPQLTSLRSEFVELKNDGFVEKVKPVRGCEEMVCEKMVHILFTNLSPACSRFAMPRLRKTKLKLIAPSTLRPLNVAVHHKLTLVDP